MLFFAAYLQLNVPLKGVFWVRYGAISRGFAPLLRTFVCEFAPTRGYRE
jgi:hypothetical protein